MRPRQLGSHAQDLIIDDGTTGSYYIPPVYSKKYTPFLNSQKDFIVWELKISFSVWLDSCVALKHFCDLFSPQVVANVCTWNWFMGLAVTVLLSEDSPVQFPSVRERGLSPSTADIFVVSSMLSQSFIFLMHELQFHFPRCIRLQYFLVFFLLLCLSRVWSPRKWNNLSAGNRMDPNLHNVFEEWGFISINIFSEESLCDYREPLCHGAKKFAKT